MTDTVDITVEENLELKKIVAEWLINRDIRNGEDYIEVLYTLMRLTVEMLAVCDIEKDQNASLHATVLTAAINQCYPEGGDEYGS